MRLQRLVRCVSLWAALAAGHAWGQAVVSPPVVVSPPAVVPQRSLVLAHLGPETITQADVDFVLGRTTAHADAPAVSDAAVPDNQAPLPAELQAQALELIAQQRRALRTLRDAQQAATPDEIEAAIRAGAPPEQRQWPLAQIIDAVSQQHSIDARKYRDIIDFRIAWPRYLNRHLTEENLRKHFEQQRARFDGSRFKVDLITITTSPGQSPSRAQAVHDLSELRSSLQSAPAPEDLLTAAATGSNQLHVLRNTWVRGWGDALPALITPLLTLEAGQFSTPLHTANGVHLIRYVDRAAGQLELADVRAEVRAHMLIFLLDYLARPQRDSWPLSAY